MLDRSVVVEENDRRTAAAGRPGVAGGLKRPVKMNGGEREFETGEVWNRVAKGDRGRRTVAQSGKRIRRERRGRANIHKQIMPGVPMKMKPVSMQGIRNSGAD